MVLVKKSLYCIPNCIICNEVKKQDHHGRKIAPKSMTFHNKEFEFHKAKMQLVEYTKIHISKR